MREITITRREFAEFLWPIVTSSAPDAVKQRFLARDVLNLLSDDDYTEEVPLTVEQIEQAARTNKHAWNSRRLRDDEHTFLVEEEECRLIEDRLISATPHVSIICLNDFSPLVDKFKDPKKHTAKVVPDEPSKSGDSEEQALEGVA